MGCRCVAVQMEGRGKAVLQRKQKGGRVKPTYSGSKREVVLRGECV